MSTIDVVKAGSSQGAGLAHPKVEISRKIDIALTRCFMVSLCINLAFCQDLIFRLHQIAPEFRSPNNPPGVPMRSTLSETRGWEMVEVEYSLGKSRIASS
jgi:hypothetical protein